MTGSLTRAGRGVLALAVAGLAGHGWLGWGELLAIGVTALAALGLALGWVVLQRPGRASLELRPAKVFAGSGAHACVEGRAAAVPTMSSVLRVQLGPTATRARLPLLLPGQTWAEELEVPTSRRGVLRCGPVLREDTDLLGLVRRVTRLDEGADLHVWPAIAPLESLAAGLVRDLEGVPSDRLSSSDLAFHALRDYVPGDDLRHVHWRASARTGDLMVRQYHDTLRAQAVLVVDDDVGSYRDDQEFELAVSAAASLAVRAAMDDFVVTVVCGADRLTAQRPEPLLDAAATWSAGTVGAPDHGRTLAEASAGASVAVLVSGGGAGLDVLRRRAADFPRDARRLVVRADSAGSSRRWAAAGLSGVQVSRLDHLAALLADAMS